MLQASLIFALGPQNIFVLESGLKKHHHLAVSFVCYLCDFSLIMLGVVGAATFFNHYPQIKILVGFIGVIFLIIYGIGKIKHQDEYHLEFERDGKRSCFKAAIISSFVFSFVNPHAYLDGIVLIGGYSAKYPDLYSRFILGLGASSFSLIWFLLLSTAGTVIMPFFKDGRRMHRVMAGAGIVLLFLSVRLSLDVLQWVNELYPETIATLKFSW
jgi:L-lysine exporter family protein LysE/ArgO